MQDYKQVLDYLFAALPMFTRIGGAAYKEGLDNTHALVDIIGKEKLHKPWVHIAGTNGKGSSSHMLASILQSAGYKTGLYTSPHLKDFRERIRINGVPIGEQVAIDFVNRYMGEFEVIQPSFFEWTWALTLDCFFKEDIEIGIIETGMGGRLDSTNVIDPLLSLITNVSYDHVQWLGDTLVKIAGEKAGIIKQNRPVVISQYQEEVEKVWEDKARAQNSKLIKAYDHWKLQTGNVYGEFEVINGIYPENKVKTDLGGRYQRYNIAGVLAAVQELRLQGWKIEDRHIVEGLALTKKQTGLRGRWEVIAENPRIVFDTGHNEAGIEEIIEQLKLEQFDQLHWVLGMVADKDITKVLSKLPKNAEYYFCAPGIPRAMKAEDLAMKALEFGLSGNIYSSVEEAFTSCKSRAKKSDLILVAGSNFTVAELI